MKKKLSEVVVKKTFSDAFKLPTKVLKSFLTWCNSPFRVTVLESTMVRSTTTE